MRLLRKYVSWEEGMMGWSVTHALVREELSLR
jgi:hypothetical protein